MKKMTKKEIIEEPLFWVIVGAIAGLLLGITILLISTN